MDALGILDDEFLQIRAKILQIGAALDRIDRADGSVASDPRMRQIAHGIDALIASGPGRAEKIQLVFSRPYDSNWRKAFALDTGGAASTDHS
jgi:hypothetical protein